MSGGRFNYYQYHIKEIAESIESVIERNGRKKTKEELKDETWRGMDWYEQSSKDLYHYKYPDEVIEQFKIGVQKLKEAEVYARRIDWLLSGDDGEESFLKRLREDLLKIDTKEIVTKNELITEEQEHKWSFTLEEVEPANPEKCECAVYQYWLRRNGCVFLMTDNITAIPHIATEVKLQSLCDLLNINNFNEMNATTL